MQISLFSLLPGHSKERGVDLYELGLQRAALADELGFRCFWVAEHHVRPVSGIPNPAVFLAAAAQRTRRIRLGTAVALLSVRHPLLVAEEYALVDRLSGGRLDFGVGSGTSPVELEGVGIEAESKRARFAETLGLVRRAWAGETGPASGRFHRVGDLRCNVEPQQRPAPPIWVAATRVDAARGAGTAGDGLLLLLSPNVPGIEDLEALIGAYRAGRAEAGRDASGARVAVAAFACVRPDAAEARDSAAAGFTRLVAAQGGAADGGAVIDAMIERDTALVGTSDCVLGRLRAFADLGVDETLLLLDFGGAPEAQIEHSMRLVAQEVAPRLL